MTQQVEGDSGDLDEPSEEVRRWAHSHALTELEDLMRQSYRMENLRVFAEAMTYRRNVVEPMLQAVAEQDAGFEL